MYNIKMQQINMKRQDITKTITNYIVQIYNLIYNVQKLYVYFLEVNLIYFQYIELFITLIIVILLFK